MKYSVVENSHRFMFLCVCVCMLMTTNIDLRMPKIITGSLVHFTNPSECNCKKHTQKYCAVKCINNKKKTQNTKLEIYVN